MSDRRWVGKGAKTLTGSAGFCVLDSISQLPLQPPSVARQGMVGDPLRHNLPSSGSSDFGRVSASFLEVVNRIGIDPNRDRLFQLWIRMRFGSEMTLALLKYPCSYSNIDQSKM